MKAPQPYLLQQTHRRQKPKKLSKFDVHDIRRWARMEGFGLPVGTQAKWMRAEYPHISESTLREVLNNHTWCDPSYDREVRLPDAPTVPTFGLLASCIALIQILFGDVCSPSH